MPGRFDVYPWNEIMRPESDVGGLGCAQRGRLLFHLPADVPCG